MKLSCESEIVFAGAVFDWNFSYAGIFFPKSDGKAARPILSLSNSSFSCWFDIFKFRDLWYITSFRIFPKTIFGLWTGIPHCFVWFVGASVFLSDVPQRGCSLRVNCNRWVSDPKPWYGFRDSEWDSFPFLDPIIAYFGAHFKRVFKKKFSVFCGFSSLISWNFFFCRKKTFFYEENCSVKIKF